MKKILAVVFILVILTFFIISIDFYMKTSRPYKGYSGTIKIQVEKGLSIYAITDILDKNGIIPNKLYFKIYYRLFCSKKNFKSGEYLFNSPLTARQIVDKLYREKLFCIKLQSRKD